MLLIRGELLRRYPDTIIYAAKAKLCGNQRVIDPTDERYPIFGGTLPTDITFLGFNLSAAGRQGRHRRRRPRASSSSSSSTRPGRGSASSRRPPAP